MSHRIRFSHLPHGARGLLCGAGALGLLLLSSLASAATYKVGPGKPYEHPNDVAGMLAPGDVVEIDGDATYPGGVIFDVPGTAAQKITIRGIRAGGKRPVLSGGTNTVEVRADHYIVEGLDLTGGSSRCFYHHADDVTLRDSVVHDCPTHGILGADSDSGSLLLEYTEVYACGGGTQHHQIYMATDESAHPKSTFRMQYCWVHDANGGNNVKSRAERNEIYYNWVEAAEYHELELIGPDGQDPELAREDSDVVGNVLVKGNDFSVTRFGGDGTGETKGRYRFVNNTVIVMPAGGAVFRLFDGIESVEMHNNAFVLQGDGAINLVRQVEAAWTTGSEVIAGSNNWVQEGAMNVPAAWAGTIKGVDAGFVDLNGHDCHLAGGALVNAGAESLSGPPGHDFPSPLAAPKWHPPLHSVQLLGGAEGRSKVGAIDIGAFELGGGVGGSGGASGNGGSGPGGSGPGGSGGAGGSNAGGSDPGGSDSGGSNSGGSGGADGGSSDSPGGDPSCGCRVPAPSDSESGLAAALLLGMVTLRRRRS
jgi:MYXO-CTERM domain-containing protein